MSFKRELSYPQSRAAVCIAGEMLLFCVLHLASGSTEHGQLVYWLVVAVFCAFIAYGRFVLQPF